MSWKYVPFAGFFLFALLISVSHAILSPGLALSDHLLWFLLQCVLLLACWYSILAIARFLDRRLSYRKSFARRVFFQVIGSTTVIMLPIAGIYYLVTRELYLTLPKQYGIIAGMLLIMVIVIMNVGIAAGSFFKQWQMAAAAKAKVEEEKRNAELELTRTKQLQAEMEMRALRAQMNPHFIFNSLNSINKYILKNDQVNASKYLTRFAKLIRLILDNSNNREVNLSDELEALKLYIDMEMLRFANKFEYEITVSEQLTPDTIMVPPLIIQPYVENAIWHGLLHKESGGRLLISLLPGSDNMLQCIIEDNGIGRKRAKELKSKSAATNKSLGMKLTEERIVMLNRYTSLHGKIDILDMEDELGDSTGTKVLLNIPI